MITFERSFINENKSKNDSNIFMNNIVDAKTLEALRNGDRKAFKDVFFAYYNKTKAFIYGYTKSDSDAEELAEDLFVNLWLNRHSIDLSKSFNSYLHTIARNAAINFLKHKQVQEKYITEMFILIRRILLSTFHIYRAGTGLLKSNRLSMKMGLFSLRLIWLVLRM